MVHRDLAKSGLIKLATLGFLDNPPSEKPSYLIVDNSAETTN
jgi:hypothetical protein